MKSSGRFLMAVLGMLVAAQCLAGPYDGAWSCNETGAGWSTSFVVAVVTRSSDNQTAYGVVAIEPGQTEYGYGIGYFSGSVFSGITHEGRQFTITVSGNSASGSTEVWNGSTFEPVTLSCFRIW